MHPVGCVAHISGGNAKEHFIWASRSGPPSLAMLRVRIRTSDIIFSVLLFCFHSYHPFRPPYYFIDLIQFHRVYILLSGESHLV